MTHWDADGEPVHEARIQMEGSPNEPDRPGEKGLFRAFVESVRRFKIFGGLDGAGIEFDRDHGFDADAVRARAEAAKLGAEAAEIHARTENDVAQAVTVNEELSRIFADPNTPQELKMLQVARLMAADPQLAAQVERVEDITNQLRVLHGTRVRVAQSAEPNLAPVATPVGARALPATTEASSHLPQPPPSAPRLGEEGRAA